MGYITPEITGKFPGYLSPSAGLKFADVPNGLAAISKVPAAGWGQILAYMAFCEVSQDQSAGTPAAAGDFGWKLITSTDPEVKKTKLNAELANGRLAMMAIIGMFFQVMGEWWWVMFKGWRVKGDGWWVNGETSSDIGPWVIWKTDLVLVFDKGWCFWLMFGQTFSVFCICFLSCEAWSMLVSASLYYIDCLVDWVHWVYCMLCYYMHCLSLLCHCLASWLNVTHSTQDGLTGSAWGDWANYTASPLRAFENELGVQAPVGFWDPAGLSSDGSVENFKRRRQTELKAWSHFYARNNGIYYTGNHRESSLATCLLLLAWSLQTCPMVLPRSPKCQQQVGVRFWPTWPSAKFPRTSLLELLLQLVTLDGSSSHLLIRRSRKQSSMQSWQTEDWRWWPSLACSFRWWRVKGEWWRVHGCLGAWWSKLRYRSISVTNKWSRI